MASQRVSFMDALRVAAQTKVAPSDWVQGEQANPSSWPASLSELVRNPKQRKKRLRGEEGPSGSSRAPGTPDLPCHPGLTPFSSPSLHALPTSHNLCPSNIPVPVHPSFSIPKQVKDGPFTTPQKDSSLEPLERVYSCAAAPSGEEMSPGSLQSPSSAAPGAKRRKPFDLGWINAVASSIRGPWCGERSPAEDEVASQLLSRSPSAAGSGNGDNGFGESNGPLGGAPGPTDAVRAKLKEGVLQRVFEERQVLQKSLSSLPEIMRWGEQLLRESPQHLSIRAEGSETAAPLQRQSPYQRWVQSPRQSDSSGCKQEDSCAGPASSLVSASAIQKCHKAAPPRRTPASSASISSAVSTSAGSSNRFPVVKTNSSSAASEPTVAEGLISSCILSKCIAAAPPGTQAFKRPAADTSLRHPLDAYPSANQWFSTRAPQQLADTPPNPQTSSCGNTDVGLVPGQGTDVTCRSLPAGAKVARGAEGAWNWGHVKTASSVAERVSASWCRAGAPEQGLGTLEDADIVIDDFLLDPAGDEKELAKEGKAPVIEDAEAFAAACMNTLSNLISGVVKGPVTRDSALMQAAQMGRAPQAASRPAPLLVDAEVLASVHPDAVAELCGGTANKAEVAEFEWDGDLPTPNVEGGSDDDLWAEALKAELPSPSPCQGRGPLW